MAYLFGYFAILYVILVGVNVLMMISSFALLASQQNVSFDIISLAYAGVLVAW